MTDPLVAFVATARPTFAVDLALERTADARRLLRDLGARVVGADDLVTTPTAAERARRERPTDADLHVQLCATFSDASAALTMWEGVDAPILLWALREPGEVGDRLLLNSLCGANLAAHALMEAGHEVRLCLGDPDEPAVRDTLAAALDGRLPDVPPPSPSHGRRAHPDTSRAVLARLRGQRIGVLGDAPEGFTPSNYDAAMLQSTFGLEVAPLDLDAIFAEIAAVPRWRRADELALANDWQPSLKTLDDAALDRFAAITIALRAWSEDERLSALSLRCWPEFPSELGACPCSSLSRLADEQLATQCERDVYGALTMLVMAAAGSGPSYLVDTVDVDPDAGIVRLWHCGSAATGLAADPDDATQDVHCNRRIGVVGNFALRPGPVMIARFTDDPDRPGRLRLLLAGGTALDAPNRFQGNTADVALDGDPTIFAERLVAGGFPHHTVVAWHDVRPELRSVADALDMTVVDL